MTGTIIFAIALPVGAKVQVRDGIDPEPKSEHAFAFAAIADATGVRNGILYMRREADGSRTFAIANTVTFHVPPVLAC